MAFYEALQDAKFVGTGVKPEQWNGTRGKTIMEDLGKSTEPKPYIEDKIAVAMDLYHTAMKDHWTWKPQGASAAGGGLLDQADLSGECAQLVSGFKALLRSPSPYGFGLADDAVASVEWPNNEQIKLFVVKHKNAPFKLHPNVLKPDWEKFAHAARFQDLYAWGNHKVLKVTCGDKFRYFDPCYNNVYLLPEEMADWRLTTEETGVMPKVGFSVLKYRGQDRQGRPVAFKAVGNATPDILKNQIKTLSGHFPVLIGPV